MKRFSSALACLFLLSVLSASAQKGGGGNVNSIKVSKCYYAVVGYVELLIKANSSDPSAHLYAYLPSGFFLGEVQNGGGSRYGGTGFLTMSVPDTITIVSSSGGSTTVKTTPFQP